MKNQEMGYGRTRLNPVVAMASPSTMSLPVHSAHNRGDATRRHSAPSHRGPSSGTASPDRQESSPLTKAATPIQSRAGPSRPCQGTRTKAGRPSRRGTGRTLPSPGRASVRTGGSTGRKEPRPWTQRSPRRSGLAQTRPKAAPQARARAQWTPRSQAPPAMAGAARRRMGQERRMRQVDQTEAESAG